MLYTSYAQKMLISAHVYLFYHKLADYSMISVDKVGSFLDVLCRKIW